MNEPQPPAPGQPKRPSASRPTSGFSKLDLTGREARRESSESVPLEAAPAALAGRLASLLEPHLRPVPMLAGGLVLGFGIGVIAGLRLAPSGAHVAYAATAPATVAAAVPTADTVLEPSATVPEQAAVRTPIEPTPPAPQPVMPARPRPSRPVAVAVPSAAPASSPAAPAGPAAGGASVPPVALAAVALPAVAAGTSGAVIADSGAVGARGGDVSPAGTSAAAAEAAPAVPPSAAESQPLVAALDALARAEATFHLEEKSFAVLKVLRVTGRFAEPADVTITVTRADGVSFAAIAAPKSGGPARCGVYLGAAPPPHPSVTAPAVVGCWEAAAAAPPR